MRVLHFLLFLKPPPLLLKLPRKGLVNLSIIPPLLSTLLTPLMELPIMAMMGAIRKLLLTGIENIIEDGGDTDYITRVERKQTLKLTHRNPPQPKQLRRTRQPLLLLRRSKKSRLLKLL
jgi:hypothetical protein